MSGKKGSSKKPPAAEGTSDQSDSSPTTPTQSPEKPNRPKRKRRTRANSCSSDGVVLEARNDMRHMERLLLHSGKLHVFRAYFGDPDLHFYTRPEGRRRHPAGARNRQPPDEGRAMAALGLLQGAVEPELDNHPLDRPLAVNVDEGSPSGVSSRGLSPGSSFPTFPPSPPPDPNADFKVVPFEGLPPISEEEAAAAPPPGQCASDQDDCYMASASASDSDEPGPSPNLNAVREAADRLNRIVEAENRPAPPPPEPLPPPEPMSLSSDPPTPRDSD